MDDRYAPLSQGSLEHGVSYLHPRESPEWVKLASPAIDVMTDFMLVQPRATNAHTRIEEALEHMKTSGVRLLLVTDDKDAVIGLVSSYDIQGEKPIRIVQETRANRSEITVRDVMTLHGDIKAVDMLSVRSASVGHVVATLRQLELRHLLVVQTGEEEETPLPGLPDSYMRGTEWDPIEIPPRKAGQRWIRGLFSAAQINRQLGVDIMESMTAAHSLSELSHELG
ncbi:MAG: CBS domain-containing protein [Gammaproteobacteria bacterium]